MVETVTNAGGLQVPANGRERDETRSEANGKTPRRSPSPVTVQPATSGTMTQNIGSQYAQYQLPAAGNALLASQSQQQLSATPAVTHNLIPDHLYPFNSPAALARQNQVLAASLLHGTPGHGPALVVPPGFVAAVPEQQPVLTVQDRPLVPPIYNGINPNYPGVRLLQGTPPIFCVENFLSAEECNFLINAACDSFTPAPVVGKGSGEVSPSRTSSTCYLAREDVPDLLRKVTLLTGKPMNHCELPQVGRYMPTQQYLQHFDAFDLATQDGRRFAANGGQRTVTVLIYLNNVAHGGQTKFPVLNFEVQPKRGMALVFFPSTIDGLLDKMALHAALPAVDPKFVSQVWIRQGEYKGQPSKRLSETMGIPFGQEFTLQKPPNMVSGYGST